MVTSTGRRRSTVLVTSVVSLVAVVLLAPASARGASPRSTPAGAATRTAQPTDPEVIVSLGDSYSSGEANPPFDDGTDEGRNRCHRSAKAWPRLLGAGRQQHFACSGAVLDDVLSIGRRPAPDDVSQLARLRKVVRADSADIVTLTIGGNDLGFSTVLARCRSTGCGDAIADARAALPTVTAELGSRDGLPAVARAAGAEARVLLVGYPRLFPESDAEVRDCDWLTSTERVSLNELATEVDQAQQSAAATAGVEHVSVLGALDGHELCSADPWLWPVSIRDCGPTGRLPRKQYCAHPTESAGDHGQRVLAGIVRKQLACSGGEVSERCGNLPVLDTRSTVTTDTYGPVAFGSTLAEAQAVSRVPWTKTSELDGCSYYVAEGLPQGVSFMVIDGVVVRVDIDTPSVRTKSGFGVGTSEADILRLFPTAAVTPHEYTDGHYVTITDSASGNKVVFETDGSTVTTYRAGRTPEVEYVEGCA